MDGRVRSLWFSHGGEARLQILECDVGASEVEFFHKLGRVLNPGGRLVIVDKFASEEEGAPVSRRHWAFLASLENADYVGLKATQLPGQLTQAGFGIHSHDRLPFSEYSRWSSEWDLIVAGMEVVDEPDD